MINLLRMLENQRTMNEEITLEGGGSPDAGGGAGPDVSTGPEGQPGISDLADGQPEYSPGFLAKIEGKGSEDLTRMLHESEKTIGQLRNKVDALKPTVRTPQSVKTEISSLAKKMDTLKQQMEELDPSLDAEAYSSKRKELRKLEQSMSTKREEYETLRLDSLVTAKLNAEHNTQFAAENRNRVATEMGLRFTDEQWADVVEAAQQFSNGKLTQEDVDAALLKTVGAAAYNKALTTQAEQKMRSDLEAARRGEQYHLGGDRGGGVDTSIPYDQMNASQQAQYIRGLSDEEFKAHLKKYNPTLRY
jgi:hypothetical protein